MGRAVVTSLAKRGYFVFAIDRRTEESGNEGILPITADLTDAGAVESMAEIIKEKCDGLFAVIHTAGYYMLDSLVEIGEDELKSAFDVNVFAAYRVNKALLPLLGKGSRIIITTSELAPLSPLPFTGLYAITKSALDKYAHSLATELSLIGISVTVLRPGAVMTDMLGASTRALDGFVEKTEHYDLAAERFRSVVNSVEARCIPAEKIAKRVVRLLESRRPRRVSSINRNPLLLMLNLLPPSLQSRIISAILKRK